MSAKPSVSRTPKKSETLEIRLDQAAKDAFMARCRSEGRTASEALRTFIDGETVQRRAGVRSPLWQAGAAVLVGLAIGAVAAPSLAQSTRMPSGAIGADVAAFQRLDRDQDGALSLSEFHRR